MNSMLKKATNDELNKLLETLFESQDISENQADLMFAIVEELNERGQMPQISDSDINDVLQIAKTPIEHNKAPQPNDNNYAWVKRALVSAMNEKKERKRQWIRKGAVLASVVVITVLLNAGSALAFHRNFLSEFFQFTGQAISSLFVEDRDPDVAIIDPNLTQLNSQLDELGISVRLPTKILDGSAFDYLNVVYDTEPYFVFAWFTYFDTERSYSIDINGDLDSAYSETDNADFIATIDHLDFTVGLYSNRDKLVAIWSDNGYAITIQGDITPNEVEALVKSIQE